jgi:DNA-binding transcriptional LysR family regulator
MASDTVSAWLPSALPVPARGPVGEPAVNLHQLRYLVATVDHGTMTAAARDLHIAQPALSRAIRNLERELGVDVFERDGRGVALTAAGATLVECARRVLDEADHLVGLAQTMRATVKPAIRVAWTPTVGARVSRRCLPAFRSREPDIGIVVVPAGAPDEVIAALASGRAEVGFTDQAVVPDGYVLSPLEEVEAVLVCPPGTDVPDPVPLAQLDGLGLILPTPGSGRRAEFDALFAHVGVAPDVVVETNDRALWTSMVLLGVGSCITYRDSAERVAEHGGVICSFDPPLGRTVSVVHGRGPLSEPARAFVESALGG